MSGSIDNSPGRTRIESWKEIASFFGRDERTVKRWEKSRRLPVHRLPGAKSGVFAYSDELVEWLHSRSGEPRAADRAEAAVLGAGDSADSAPAPAATISPGFLVAHREFLWLATLLTLLLTVALAFKTLRTLRSSPSRMASAARPVSAPGSASPAAELCLQGRYYWSHRTEGTLRQAEEAFSQAVARDPKYAPAYAGLADSYNLMPLYTGMLGSKAFPIAIQAAQKAVSLDDSLAEAHRALAFGLFFWDWEADPAFREFRRAAQLDPSDEDAHSWYAIALFTLGRYPEAESEIELARRIEPTSRSVLASQGLIRYWAGERDKGITQLQELEASEPDFSAPGQFLAIIYFDQRNYPAYIEQLKRDADLSRKPDQILLASAAATGWKQSGARGMLEGVRTEYLHSYQIGESSGFELASVCARLGRRHEADQYLQAAMEARDYHVMHVLKGDLDPDMRGDPRFEQLKREIRKRVTFPRESNIAK